MPAALVNSPTTIAEFKDGRPSKIAVSNKFLIDGSLDENTRSWVLDATIAFDKRGSYRPTENLAQLMAILFAVQHVRMNSLATASQALVEILTTAFQSEKAKAEIEAQAVIRLGDQKGFAPPPPASVARTGDPKRVRRTKEPIAEIETGEIFAGQIGALAIIGLNEKWAALTCQAPRTPFFRIDLIEHFVDLREFISGGPTPYVRTHREAFPDSSFSPEIIRQATASV